MRKFLLLLPVVAAGLLLLTASEAMASYKYDLALWRFFQVEAPDGSLYARDSITFGKTSVSDTFGDNTRTGDALMITVTDSDGGQTSYVWYNGQYVQWKDADGRSTVQKSELDTSKTLKISANQGAFKGFVSKWGALWAPPVMSPAETLGHSGWDVGVESNMSYMFGNASTCWTDAFAGIDRLDPDKPDTPADLLPMVRLHLRKGLPFSTELGANVAYMPESRLFSMGAEFKVAVYEGYDYAPDVAMRFTYNHVFGAPDLNTDLFGGDISVSYAVGLGGAVELTPYTGYSFMAARVRATVQNASFHTITSACVNETGSNFCGDYDGALLYFSPETALLHRWFLGVRLVVARFTIGVENILTNENDQFTVKLGVDF